MQMVFETASKALEVSPRKSPGNLILARRGDPEARLKLMRQ